MYKVGKYRTIVSHYDYLNCVHDYTMYHALCIEHISKYIISLSPFDI